MSYLERLIERATDTDLDLENNQIGNYRITPQHGNELVQYFIYKNNCKPINSNTKKRYNNIHVVDITISGNSVQINVNIDYLNQNEISNIINTIYNIYYKFDINVKNF